MGRTIKKILVPEISYKGQFSCKNLIPTSYFSDAVPYKKSLRLKFFPFVLISFPAKPNLYYGTNHKKNSRSRDFL